MRSLFRPGCLAILLLLFIASTDSSRLSAQLRVHTVAELPNDVALKLELRKLASSGTFMQTTAHPDDEDSALLAQLGFGEGMRAVLVSATRGDGGQNEIGPELFQALGVLRTEELQAVHRFDGAEQYFTRAVDFGYSFSVDESIEKWGHDAILGDFVRLIRTIRPDVIAGFLCGGEGGGPASPGDGAAHDSRRSVRRPIRHGSPNSLARDCVRGRRHASSAPTSRASRAARRWIARRCGSNRRPSTRFWAAPTASSGSRRAACTSARGRRSSCCFPAASSRASTG